MKSRSEAKAAAEKTTKEEKPKDESVRDLSESLERELNPFNFESANAKKTPVIRSDFGKIVETVFVNDLHETWAKLKKALVVGEKRSDHGTLQQALDQAEKNAYDAHRLYVTAKIEFEAWEKDHDIVVGAFWSEAIRSIQKEKDEGTRSKQVTDADVRARVATIHPDDWKVLEVRKAKYKATVDSLANLSEQWNSRCRTLQTMMGKLRS